MLQKGSLGRQIGFKLGTQGGADTVKERSDSKGINE